MVPVDVVLLRVVLFENRVKVTAPEAEGADPRPARMLFVREPGTFFGVEVERRMF